MIKHTDLFVEAISEFKISASYVELDKNSPENVNDPHIHPECEIYVNLSGDVSFMVEGKIYPVVSGNIIISKPYEYHHCVYNSDGLHRHYWILLSIPDDEKTKSLLSFILEKPRGANNLLALPYEKEKEFLSSLKSIVNDDLDEIEKAAITFKFLSLLKSAKPISDLKSYSNSNDISAAINYIDEHFTEPSLRVEDVAEVCGLSVNTLERHFRKVLTISPITYLKKKRLALSARLLAEGKNVSECCELSGFSDYSYFISMFKKTYGVTPLKYKKQLS